MRGILRSAFPYRHLAAFLFLAGPAIAATPPAAIRKGAMPMSMPILPEAETLAGEWRVAADPGGIEDSCTLTLTWRPLGNGHAVTGAAGCRGIPGLDDVALWRSASDGIDLAGPDELTIAFFSRRSDGSYAWRALGGITVRLHRQ